MWSCIQQNITQQFFTVHRTSSLLSTLSLLTAFIATCFPLEASAGAATDTQFRRYIQGICAGTITAPQGVVWDAVALGAMCAATGAVAGGNGSVVSANLGIADTGSGTISLENKKDYECLDDFKQKPGSKGCATDGWGLLISTQFGRSIRQETELENGFQSDLLGLLIGLDYRYSDSFILGSAASQTRDEAVFISSAGSLKSISNTLTMYATWLPLEKVSVDGYLGYGVVNFDSQRRVFFNSPLGTASGSTSGRQNMAGLSTAYQSKFGSVNVAPFINLDYIKTDIKGYNETGRTTLELRYGDRNTISTTASLGLRLSQSYNFNWGSLNPTLHGAGVHEFKNNSTLINNELVLTPGAGILVATDEPDRDYFLSGLGFAAALKSGTQLFLNYERRSGDSLLDSWAVSLGLLKEF